MKARATLHAGAKTLSAFLLSLLLAVQVATAFAHSGALSGAGNGVYTLVICSGDGVRTITLSADGTEQREAPAPGSPGSLEGHCPLCTMPADTPGCASTPVAPQRIALAPHPAVAAAPQLSGLVGPHPAPIRAPPFTV